MKGMVLQQLWCFIIRTPRVQFLKHRYCSLGFKTFSKVLWLPSHCQGPQDETSEVRPHLPSEKACRAVVGLLCELQKTQSPCLPTSMHSHTHPKFLRVSARVWSTKCNCIKILRVHMGKSKMPTQTEHKVGEGEVVLCACQVKIWLFNYWSWTC